MNLEELKLVWRSQDEAPLHGLNETLLRLALRQNEAKRQKWRRIERWIIYGLSAGVVAGTALCLIKPFHRTNMCQGKIPHMDVVA